MIEGQLVCIVAEEDMIAATSSETPYVEADEKALKCSFRSLEFVNDMYRGGIEGPNAKIIRYHSCENKTIARQKSPNGKRIREKATRHAEANHCDPEKG